MSNLRSKLGLKIGGILMSIMSFAATERGDFHIIYQGQTVDNLIIKYMEENNIPGLSLAIVQAPYIPRVVSYGLSDNKAKRLAATNTVFNIGQITNGFTAIAIMQLKAEGKLSLDNAITNYLPNIPQKWSSISIRNLITHTSGLPSYSAVKDFDYSKKYTPQQILALIQDQNLLFKPSTKGNFSATDYYLLGLIIEKVSGISYEEHITKNQIERIGLKHTFFISNQDKIKNKVNNGIKPLKNNEFLHNPILINPTELATGYSEFNGELKQTRANSWSATFADSGMVASSEDISLWDIALAGDILIKDPNDRALIYSTVTLQNKKVIPANANWFFPGHKGLMEIKGNIPGYSSFLARFTDELVCVTLLVNKQDIPDLDILGRKIAGAFNEKLATPKASKWSITMQSPYDVKSTIDRVADIIKAQGGTIFARVDHAAEAAKVNQTLLPTQVLIVGNPAQGTSLMQNNPSIALDLPLKIMATQDKSGQIWLSFTDPVALAKEYGDQTKEQLAHLRKIYHGLLKVCQKAISPY